MIHLDTCFLIKALVHGSAEDQRLRVWLSAGEILGISSVGWAEFLCGLLTPSHFGLARRVVTVQVPFDAEAARLAAILFNAGGRRRGSLLDCMIAATAIEEQASLATTNRTDFRRFAEHGLTVI